MNKTPQLRFKEFRGDWETKKAKELFESISDKKHNGDLEVLSSTQDRGVIPRSKLNIDIKFEQNNLTSYKKVKESDFIISLRSFQGGIEHSHYTGLVSPAYTVFNFKNNIDLNYKFFAEIFKTQNFINKLNTLTYGIRDGKAISFKDFSDVKLNFPRKEEQEKIASFFSLIDDKISLQSDKVEALKDYKKGMMQKIFSRELRFKDDDGRDYPEWENIELKEVIELTIDNRGKTPPLSQNGIPLLEVNSLGGIYPDFTKINKFVDKETYNGWFRTHIQQGDLLFTTVGATGLVSLSDSTKSCIAQNIVGFRFKESCSPEFMYNLFNYRETIKRIKSIEMGAVQPSIKVTQLIKLKFLIPSIEEQIKIGHTLSSIDLKIEKEQEKLNSLNEYKRGLLQQMFV